MSTGTELGGGFMIEGFHAQVALWVWCALALLYGLWRSLASPDPDPIRPSGPVD
jgi:hypothetical protein